MIESLIQNLPFLIPLFFLSVASWVIILEKMGFLLKNRIPSNLWVETIIQEYSRGRGFKDSENPAQGTSPELRLIHYYESEKSDADFRFELVSHRAANELKEFDKGLGFLPGLANISTLIGLFGTVTGMIATFFSFREAMNPDPSLLAGGISQALLTTAAGLLVAIPALFFYMIFQPRLKAHQKNLEAFLEIWYEKT